VISGAVPVATTVVVAKPAMAPARRVIRAWRCGRMAGLVVAMKAALMLNARRRPAMASAARTRASGVHLPAAEALD